MQKVMFKGKWVCLHMPLVFGKIDLRIFEINLVYIAASFSIFPFVYLICTISSRASSRKWGHCCSVCEKRHRSPTKRKKKKLNCYFYIFHHKKLLKILWKILFILLKKLFLFWRYCLFILFYFPCPPPCCLPCQQLQKL